MGKAMENASKAATAAVAAISKVSETDTEEQPQDSWGVLEWVRYTVSYTHLDVDKRQRLHRLRKLSSYAGCRFAVIWQSWKR